MDDAGTITGHGYAGGGVIGSTTMGLRSATATFQAVAYPDLQPEPEVGDGWVRFTQTGRRSHRRPGASSGGQAALRAVPRAHRVVDALAHDPRRRPRRTGTWWAPARSPATGSTDHAGALEAQDRPHRLQGLVPPRLRRPQPVGRRRLAGARHRGGDGARAPALPRDHGGGQAQGAQAQGRRRPHRNKARRPTRCSCCSTA